MGHPDLIHTEEARENFAGSAFDDMREGRGIERGLGSDVDGAGSSVPGPVDKAGCRIDGAGGADDEHQSGFGDLQLDAIHLVGDLAEEDDVGAETAAARTMANFREAGVDGVVFDGSPAAVAFAVSFQEFAVHVEKAD